MRAVAAYHLVVEGHCADTRRGEGQQRPTGRLVQVEWTLNAVSLIAIATAGLTALKAWYDGNAKAEQACRLAREAQQAADKAHEKIAMLQAAISSYREIQAERLVSREVLREVEDRLAGAIDNLGNRLDTLVRELLKIGKVP
jgi:biopolymer transport protein ExbB/TolQ